MQILAKIVNDPINSSGIFAAGLGLCIWHGLYWHCGIEIPQLALCGQHPKVWLPFVVKRLGRGGAFCFKEDCRKRDLKRIRSSYGFVLSRHDSGRRMESWPSL